ncbi:MAG: hypothetical protein U0326_40225 [Polyangiales bacterium]
MRTNARLSAAFAFAASLFAGRAAQADPPSFRAVPSLREGMRVEACASPDRCETWVQFAPRPYRTFVEARMAPSGRFFYVWSRPDGRPREVDVFATPRREGQLAQRRGHWSPGAGGDLVWVTRDRLWHRWGCGSACNIAQLYDVYGTTLASFVGQDAEVSPDGRFAVIADAGEGTLLDLNQATTRSFRGPDGLRYAWDVDWTDHDVTVWFDDDDTDSRGAESRRAVHLAIAPSPAAVAAEPSAAPAQPVTVPASHASRVAVAAPVAHAPVAHPPVAHAPVVAPRRELAPAVARRAVAPVVAAPRRAPLAAPATTRVAPRASTVTHAAVQPRLATTRALAPLRGR